MRYRRRGRLPAAAVLRLGSQRGSSPFKVPARIAWAVDLLAVEPQDQILEIGCGPGIAVALVCADLDGGRITAIDRSPTAIERTRARTTGHVAAGRAVLLNVDLAGFHGEPDQFDKAFAVNVNAFWTSPAERECEVLRRVVRPGGVLRLVYGEDPSGRVRDLGARIVPKLERYGFRCDVTVHSAGAMVCVTGRLLKAGARPVHERRVI